MSFDLISFFTDPVLRAPTLGSIFMCISSSLVGVLVFLRKRSLLGEALSHTSYPGVALAVSTFAAFFSPSSDGFVFAILFFAFLSSVLGLLCIDFLKKRFRVYDDAALTFVLSSFFGIGVLLASRLQTTHAVWYKQVQTFLYGQAATMRDVHIFIYLALFIFILLAVLILYKNIQMLIFDQNYMRSLGVQVRYTEMLFVFLTCLAVVVGIRSVGVVMMAGMLIAPALTARCIAKSLKQMFLFAALFGGVSGFLGNYLSVSVPELFPGTRFVLPTGPMILIIASVLCFAFLIFSPPNGLLWKKLSRKKIKSKILLDETLKFIYSRPGKLASIFQIKEELSISFLRAYFILWILFTKRFLMLKNGSCCLTKRGSKKAIDIFKCHRLWGLYLIDFENDCRYSSLYDLTPELLKDLQEFEHVKYNHGEK
ncbi:MAG: metal ABC transporter permease [Chlamydiae bacterium]|nr:metal ABC transporter permease [Chlamydiota bacterium]